ncbi:hypothetical protein Q3A68_09700 [Mucilaginibacter sp. BT774]|nr:hypothetical protein [Mucilaginibacter sp. BT774]
MKRISVLRNESTRIESRIKKLLTQRYSYENGLVKQLGVLASISRLYDKMSELHREIQQRDTLSA